MVMGHEVIHQHQNEDHSLSSSFVIMSAVDEHGSNVALDRIEIATMYSKDENRSFVDNIPSLRDASDTSRHFELDNTRDSVSTKQNITLNTHDSILDLESQGGDDDTSFADHDENIMGIIDISSNSIVNNICRDKSTEIKMEARSVSPNPSTNKEEKIGSSVKSIRQEHDEAQGIMGGLTLYSVTDTFVDTLCTSTACVVSDNYTELGNKNHEKDNKAISRMDDKISKFKQSCHSALFDDCKIGNFPDFQDRPSSEAVASMDIWQLLGCSNLPGDSEMEEIWSLRTPRGMLQYEQQSGKRHNSKQPFRASIKKRMKRIHRLRMDDRRISGASRHGVTITNHCIDPSYHTLNNIRNHIHMNKNNGHVDSADNDVNDEQFRVRDPQHIQPSYRAIEKSYSMLDDPLADFIGQGLVEPIPVQVEDGYDSDPEVNCYSGSSSMVTESPTRCQVERMEDDSVSVAFTTSSNAPQHRDVLRVDPIPTEEGEMRESVQQTLNSTWTLTWHPNAENIKEYNLPHSKPICINMWLERGAVMTNSGVVVEPAFMWRDAYQPLLLTQHKLNNSSQKPWSMRLLNACRITTYFPCPSNNSTFNNSIDRDKYPLARKNSSFLLKSCGGEEFLLEAKDQEDAFAITQRWKLVVARFACLAVTEDVGGIAKEFFHPTSDSKMLTIPDPNNMF